MAGIVRGSLTLLLVALALAGALAIAAGVWLIRGGISAKGQPGAFETAVARRLRAAAIPGRARTLGNPVQATPEVINAGMEHFADHCAVCHANDGSGDTEMGRGLYPKVPDMRQAATQSLSDGELFYIIENGVRFTGMPAFGSGKSDPAGEKQTWDLVTFIRHLPRLTPDELGYMQSLNPL